MSGSQANPTEDERPVVEHTGPFKAVDVIDRRLSQHAAFVTVIVEGADGRRYSYDTSCMYFDLKPYTGKAP